MATARRLIALLSAALFVASLFVPAITAGETSRDGLYVLLFGSFGMLYGEFRWFANCFYVAAVLFALIERKPGWAFAVCALLALAMGLSCFVWPPIIVSGAGDYSSHKADMALGGILWVVAQAVALIAVLTPSPVVSRDPLTRSGRNDV